MKIPFNSVYKTGREIKYVNKSIRSANHSGNRIYGKRVTALIKEKYFYDEVFLTPSCTAALEMGALLANIQPGDEVIIPSYTFSSTVNSVVIFGAKPIFCEISPETMNIDVSKIEKLITPRTKMIIPIDYGGVSCEIDRIMEIAERHKLIVMQDCAQSYGSLYKGKPTGREPHLACFSFHETKNYSCGEGGALIVNVPEWKERASYLQEKGTDRTKVLHGVQDRYSWVDVGSSYLLSDILAAMLLAQLEAEDEIREKRRVITAAYKALLKPYFEKGLIRTSSYGNEHEINHHAFWIVLDTSLNRDKFIQILKENDILAYIGYIPLHSSKMGRSFGYSEEDLPITTDMASRLVRLPFYTSLSDNGLNYCCLKIKEALDIIFY